MGIMTKRGEPSSTVPHLQSANRLLVSLWLAAAVCWHAIIVPLVNERSLATGKHKFEVNVHVLCSSLCGCTDTNLQGPTRLKAAAVLQQLVLQ